MPREPEAELQTLSDQYHRRRALTSGETYTTTIEDVTTGFGYVYLTVRVAGEYWVLTCSKTRRWDTKYGLARLLRELTNQPVADTDITALQGQTIQIEFTEDLSACTLPDTTDALALHVHHPPTSTLVGDALQRSRDDIEWGQSPTDRPRFPKADDDNTVESLERELTLTRRYCATDRAWRTTIAAVTPTDTDEETFTVTVETDTDYPLTWTFELPATPDPDKNDVAHLIESVGGGELQFLEDSDIYVVAVDDVDEQVRTVGVDETENWALVTPTDYTAWQSATETAEENSDETDPLFPVEWGISLSMGSVMMFSICYIMTTRIQALRRQQDIAASAAIMDVYEVFSTVQAVAAVGIVIGFILIAIWECWHRETILSAVTT